MESAFLQIRKQGKSTVPNQLLVHQTLVSIEKEIDSSSPVAYLSILVTLITDNQLIEPCFYLLAIVLPNVSYDVIRFKSSTLASLCFPHLPSASAPLVRSVFSIDLGYCLHRVPSTCSRRKLVEKSSNLFSLYKHSCSLLRSSS